MRDPGSEDPLRPPCASAARHGTGPRRSGARTSRWRHPLGFALLTAACLAFALSPVGAQSADDPETQRQQTEQRRQAVGDQIDELSATDDQLKAELDKLEVGVHEQEARAASARDQRDVARRQVDDLNRQVVDAEHAAAQARHDAASRAVEAYMRPDRETAVQELAAKDPQQMGKMHTLMTNLAQYNHTVVENRVTAEQDLKTKKDEAQEAHDRADSYAQEADAGVAEAARLRDRQAAVGAELDKRIANLQGEAANLDQQEARLSQLIAARQVVAPIETTTTTTEPSTTIAPTTTTTTITTTTVAPITTTGKPGSPPPPSTSPPPTAAPTTTRPPTTTPVTTKPSGPGRGTLSWPVSGPVTSPFGARWGTVHKGIDIGVGMGTPIHAARAGTVFFAGVIDGYGNVVLIDHGGGMVTLYAHQSQLIATQGQSVAAGATIGLVGSTGHSTGPHLHFEVRINGVAVDPMSYLP